MKAVRRVPMLLAVSAGFVLLTLAVAAQLDALWLASLDRGGFRLAAALRTPLLTGIMKAVTLTGDKIMVVPAALALTVWTVRSGRPWAAAWLALTLLLAEGLSEWAKWYVDRPRPLGNPLIPLPDSQSFPSGHAMVSGAFFLMAGWMLDRLLRTPGTFFALGAAWAGLVAASRVYLGVHYLSDVLAGLFMAAAMFCLFLALASTRGESPGVPPGKPVDYTE